MRGDRKSFFNDPHGEGLLLPDDVRSMGVAGLVQFGSVLFACKPTNHEGC